MDGNKSSVEILDGAFGVSLEKGNVVYESGTNSETPMQKAFREAQEKKAAANK